MFGAEVEGSYILLLFVNLQSFGNFGMEEVKLGWHNHREHRTQSDNNQKYDMRKMTIWCVVAATIYQTDNNKLLHMHTNEQTNK